ncbi:MAG TPA: substrate-binding domain-containing protein [Bacteroidales bacterium]|jgi:LacI family transcriptional regulator|nr:substrate-binding domain-containing protein [Bacteroidales bacterium]
MNPGKPRIKDIALLAGVSIGTVDRVIHNRGEVSEKTSKKIRGLLKETNYSPNVMARALKSKKKYHIVSLLPDPTEVNSYWLKHPTGMAKAVAELQPFPISLTEIRFDMQDEADFQSKTIDVLKLNPDGVLLAPIFKTESISFCSRLNRKKIPYVFIDGFIEKTGFLAYIGENVYQSGKVAGQLTDMITPPAKDILVVNIARDLRNVQHLKNRTMGFLSYFGKNSKNTGNKLDISIKEPDIHEVDHEMDNIMKKHPEVGAIFVSGSKSYLIARYLEQRRFRNINLIGYDLVDSNVEYLKSGQTRFLLGQRPVEQTYIAIKKLFEYLAFERIPEKYEYLPVDIISSENVDFFI